jgi:phage gp45-like
MSFFAKIKNAVFSQEDDAPGSSITVDVENTGDNFDDAEMYQMPGFFAKPQDGLQAVVLEIAGQNIVIATQDYKFNKNIDKGNVLIYSYDGDGNIKGEIEINQSGEIVINEGTKSAVSFEELQTQFEELKNAFNTHTHTYSPGPGSPTPSGPASPQSAADLSDAEVEEVKLP